MVLRIFTLLHLHRSSYPGDQGLHLIFHTDAAGGSPAFGSPFQGASVLSVVSGRRFAWLPYQHHPRARIRLLLAAVLRRNCRGERII